MLGSSRSSGKNRLNRLYNWSSTYEEGEVNEISDVFLSIRLGLARAVSRIVPPHEVEDIVQETYVRLCKVGKADHVEHPKSYLFRTARNLALDSVKRAESRLTEHLDESEAPGFSQSNVLIDETFEQTASSEEFGHFCEAVRQLPLQARRVFVLKKVYGYSQREIARELGIAESTVEKHVALAVRRCAAYLKEESWQASVRLDQVEAHHE